MSEFTPQKYETKIEFVYEGADGEKGAMLALSDLMEYLIGNKGHYIGGTYEKYGTVEGDTVKISIPMKVED